MTEYVKHKCDRCRQWKPAPEPGMSYFTDRMWFCDDCKYERAVNSGKVEVSTVVKSMGEDK